MEVFSKQLNDIVIKAGKIGLDLKDDYSTMYKNKGELYTTADLHMNEYLKTNLSKLLGQASLILEETEDGKTLDDKLHDAKASFSNDYIWAVDPLDGSINFPGDVWCVSAALLERRDNGFLPIMAGIYVPNYDELFYSDGKKSYVSYLNTDVTRRIQIGNPGNSAIIQNYKSKQGKYTYGKLDNVIVNSTVFNMASVACGDSVGTITSGNIWDIAGGMALGNKVGVYIHDPESAQKIKYLTLNDFRLDEENPWKLPKEYYFCSTYNFSLLANEIRPKRSNVLRMPSV